MFEKYQLTIISIIVSLGLIFAVKVGTTTFSRDSITVTGSAYEIVKSDSASIDFEICKKAPTRADAYKLANEQLPIVKSYLEEKGIKDIETKAFHGYYNYKYTANGINTNEIVSYNLYLPVSIKSNDVEKIKEISTNLQSLIDKGVEININSTNYYYSKLADKKIKLLEDAAQDAKERAKAMLKPTHTRLGKIKSIQMGVFQITPVNSTNVSDSGISDTSTIDKKVTAVAKVVFKVK